MADHLSQGDRPQSCFWESRPVSYDRYRLGNRFCRCIFQSWLGRHRDQREKERDQRPDPASVQLLLGLLLCHPCESVWY